MLRYRRKRGCEADEEVVVKASDVMAFWPLTGWGILGAWGLVSLALVVPATPGGATFANVFTTGASIVSCLIVWVLSRLGTHRDGVEDVRGPTRFLSRNPLLWGGAVAFCSVANQVMQLVSSPVFAILAAQAVASFAYIVLMYQWFCVYCELDPQQIESGSIRSVVLTALICLVALVVPRFVDGLLWAALPLASATCLVTARALRRPEVVPGSISPASLGQICPKGWKTALTAVLACGVVTVLPQNMDLATGTDTARLANLGGVLAAAMLSAWYVSSARRIDAGSLFKMLYPLVAASLFLSSMAHIGLSTAGLFLASAGQWALYVFAWVYAAEAGPLQGRVSYRDMLGRFVMSRIFFDLGGFCGAVASFMFNENNGVLAQSSVSTFFFGALAIFVALTSPLLRFDAGAGEARHVDVDTLAGRNPSATDVQSDIDALLLQRAEALSSAYGMSAREEEILGLLLRGYSTAAIRNELAIAKGTVDTYIQRMYRKCGVHSRQELVELAHAFSGSIHREASMPMGEHAGR